VSGLAFPLGIGGGLGGPVAVTAPAVSSCDVWAADMLEVVFDQLMANNADLNNPANYAVAADVPGSAIPVVTAVRPHGTGPTRRVFLQISTFDVGQKYTVSVNRAIANTDNVALGASNTARFVGRSTKVDNAVKSRPGFYDTSFNTNLRAVLNAVMRSDDLIGGSRKDRLA